MIENGKRWVLQCLRPNQPPHTTFLKRSIISFFFILNSLISPSSISNYQCNLVAKRQIHFLKFSSAFKDQLSFRSVCCYCTIPRVQWLTLGAGYCKISPRKIINYEAAFYLSCFSCFSTSIVILKNSEVYSHVIWCWFYCVAFNPILSPGLQYFFN